MSFFAELKRRNVVKVGIAYAVSTWVLLQITDIVSEIMALPDWAPKLILLILIIGFVPALIFAWAFELTPDGVKREKDVDRSQSITPKTGQRLNKTIGALLVIALAYIAYDKLAVGTSNEPAPAEQAAAESSDVATEAPVPDEDKTAAVDEGQKSIVVLPFVNMSNDPEQEFFSDGLSEELLNVLAQIKDLRVISRTSAFAFKGKDMDIPTIAAQLDVSHVLEGSVRKAGNDVRITAQLIEVATDSHLWSDAYNRKLENVFEIQEEISKAIAKELQVTLGTSGQAGKPTDNLEAWQLYLRGRHLYQNRGNAQLERSLELLKQAVALDPEFAEAWANLAAANVVYGFSQNDGFEQYYRNGQQAALRAIEIDPDNGFAHAVLGLSHTGNFAWEDAMREYALAIQLNPNETNSLLWKGIALKSLGYIDEALAIFKQAEKLDPVFTNLQFWLAGTYLAKGDIETMHRIEQKILRLDPEFRGVDQGSYELLSGNLDAAERIARASDMEQIGSDVLSAAMYSALRNPDLKEQAIETLLANKALAPAGDLTTYLWWVGATEETLSSFQRLRERGRGLRAANSLSTTKPPCHASIFRSQWHGGLLAQTRQPRLLPR
jgi:TolB-like protein/Flp pilus assembly protein TadD